MQMCNKRLFKTKKHACSVIWQQQNPKALEYARSFESSKISKVVEYQATLFGLI